MDTLFTPILKGKLKDYVETITRKSKHGSGYICPLCGSGSGKHGTGAFSLYDGGTRWHCFVCGQDGDLFDLIGLHEKITEKTEQIERANAHLKHGSSRTGAAHSKPRDKEHPADPRPSVDIEPFIRAAQAAVNKTTYLKDRGFTDEIITKFRLGYYDGSPDQVAALRQIFGKNPYRQPAIVIPYPNEPYFAVRLLNDEGQGKYQKPPTKLFGAEPLFNSQALYNTAGRPVFVVEGAFDAISIIQAGGVAASLFGTGGERLVRQLKKATTQNTVIISLDNDPTGRKETASLIEKLKEEGVNSMDRIIGAETDYKDANEYLLADFERLCSEVAGIEQEADPAQLHQKNSASSMVDSLKEKIFSGKSSPCIPTGFGLIDEALGDKDRNKNIIKAGLYEGLYIIGAGSSLGKTSLMLQMADNIASAGTDVLYYSLEMSAHELIAKSISRLTYKLSAGYPANAKTTRGIMAADRYKDYSSEELALIESAFRDYKNNGKCMFIREGRGDIKTDQIAKEVRRHIETTSRRPVVFIDYLQLLAPHSDRMSEKQSIDKSVLELKRLTSDMEIPVVAISSFNRASYTASAAMEAFKESGSIEYSSDVLLALQPHGLKHGKGAGTQEDNAKEINAYRSSEVREAELHILKNRNGATGKTVKLRYNSLFNHFVETSW